MNSFKVLFSKQSGQVRIYFCKRNLDQRQGCLIALGFNRICNNRDSSFTATSMLVFP